MTETFPALITAARTAADEIDERPGDPLRSFLKATLEAAIASHLPGQTELTQQPRRWPVEGFEPHPYGVDIDWRDNGLHTGIEVKVSGAIDSLFDVVKLATALAYGKLDAGFCAVAADAPHWARGGAFTAMTEAPVGEWRSWTVDQLLAAPRDCAAVLVTRGPRPHTVPAQVETKAAPAIALPKASTHELRVLAVRPATDSGRLDLPPRAA